MSNQYELKIDGSLIAYVEAKSQAAARKYAAKMVKVRTLREDEVEKIRGQGLPIFDAATGNLTGVAK